ncbi:phage portal protein [Neptunicella sp.]|uniref:phage portal protein n=1 Tax=Neptunicella sp. TaxID=2125986 RepID=UPI003F68E9D9
MKIFRGIRTWFGGNATGVEVGDQSGEPDLYNTASAALVTENTALQVSAVWACARLLSEVFASLPLRMYKINNGQREKITSHRLLTILTRTPNSRMTQVEFTETMQLNLVLHGNAYARIERNTAQQVVALWPLPAQHVQTELLKNGSVVHNWYHGSDVTVLSDKNVLHIRLFGNGLVGLSPLAYARNSVGLASAADTYASKYFVNGGKPSGVLYTDATLTREQRNLTRENFKEIAEEKEESKRLLVLPSGFKYQQIQMSPSDMQMLETRHFQLKDICRFFGNVPPVLIGETQDTTTLGSSIEQILIGWYRLGLNPYASRWEQAIQKKLFTPAERVNHQFDYDFSALTRGDSKTQMEYIKGMVGGPIMTPDEGREVLNLPEMPDGSGKKLNPAPSVGRNDSKEVTTNG